ncbi:type I methionyl aminopeptidase [Erysipelothrix aquatica]|uniref:type I methionyl aminopeptidase n=1 Tax=Erysipelothrix aquatica TaxID=2683714 RepID=UPI00135A1D5A|nr:type I methionyl aminopeptidase [Erysipelothrix aquatica]
MITLKSAREIEGMEASGQLLARVHEALRTFIKPGITTHDIDQFVQTMIEENGGTAAQIGYQGYKYATCISVNDEMCHGFPTSQVLKTNDLVKVDFCIDLHGFLSDSCWAYCVGDNTPEPIQTLMDVTLKALELGIEQAVAGNRTGDIGYVMDEYIKQFGYKMSLEFTGHGLGPTIHEDPMVPFTGQKGTGTLLKKGMVITIEPIVNVGTHYAKLDSNGWTARTVDGSLSCQYEHTLAITDGKPHILTLQK